MRNIEKQLKDELDVKFKPYFDKLLIYTKKNGIDTIFEDWNVTFTKEGKDLHISYNYLYRQSGISRVHKELTESTIELIDVTDEMFYNNYIKTIIDLNFIKK